MLFLVSTPIGHLKDLTLRAIEVLKSVETILCEDTRHSLSLLREYGIEVPLQPYHKFNEARLLPSLIERLKGGEKMALISDAGTPAIADPGESLVAACREEGIPLFPIPGASSLLAALVASGLPTLPFQWIGFLPRKKGELEERFKELLSYRGTTIAFEAPHRLMKTLELLRTLAPTRRMVVAREITKKFESFLSGTPAELLEKFQEAPRGEIVLLIAPAAKGEGEGPGDDGESLLRELLEERGMRLRDAVEAAEELTGLSRKLLYQRALKLKESLEEDEND